MFEFTTEGSMIKDVSILHAGDLNSLQKRYDLGGDPLCENHGRSWLFRIVGRWPYTFA
jgi:hypothetical protein